MLRAINPINKDKIGHLEMDTIHKVGRIISTDPEREFKIFEIQIHEDYRGEIWLSANVDGKFINLELITEGIYKELKRLVEPSL